MKVIVVFILIAIGVFLFRRAQRLTKEEQATMMAQKTTETSVVDAVPVDSEELVSLNKEVIESSIQADPIKDKAIETELLSLAPQEQINDSVHLSESLEAVHNKEVVAQEAVELVTSAPNVDLEVVSEQSQDFVPSVAPSFPQIDIATPGVWANITLQRAFEGYRQAGSVLERYLALQNIISECYKQRKSTDYLNYGVQLVQPYTALFDGAYTEKGNSAELKTSGFLHLTTLLNDTQAFDAAIALCRKALELGLNDGTVTGFEGRISRIEKAQSKAATA